MVSYTSTRSFYAIINLGSRKESGSKQDIQSDWRLVILTTIVEIVFCLDKSLLVLLYGYISVGALKNLGRTFQKGVRPWAQEFVWPNASLQVH